MVHHYCFGLLSSVLEAFPSKATEQGSDTAGKTIGASSNLAGRTASTLWILFAVCGSYTVAPCLIAGIIDSIWAGSQVS